MRVGNNGEIDLKTFAKFAKSHSLVILGDVFSFVPFHLLAALPRSLLPDVSKQYTHLTIDASTEAEQLFWHMLSAKPVLCWLWGKRLTRLESIVLKYPNKTPAWCLTSLISLIEGHAAARRAMVVRHARSHLQVSQLREGTLTSISFESVDVALTDEQQRPTPDLLPPKSTHPTSLPALVSISGIRYGHRVLAKAAAGRGWQWPSLRCLAVDSTGGHICSGGALCGFVGGLTTLTRLDASCSLADKAAIVESMGAASQLESIGELHIDGKGADKDLMRLKDALVARKCHSLTSIEAHVGTHVDASIIPKLAALEFLHAAVSKSPDTPIIFHFTSGSSSVFDLALLGASARVTTPFVKTALSDLADHTEDVVWKLGDDGGGDKASSAAAEELAASLTFKKAASLKVVTDETNPTQLPAHIIAHTAFINRHAFPSVTRVHLRGSVACTAMQHIMQAGVRLPALAGVLLFDGVSVDEASSVLAAIGDEARLDSLYVELKSATGAIKWPQAEGLPSVKNLEIWTKLPSDTDAGEFTSTSMASLVAARGVREVKLVLHHIRRSMMQDVHSVMDGLFIGEFRVASSAQWNLRRGDGPLRGGQLMVMCALPVARI